MHPWGRIKLRLLWVGSRKFDQPLLNFEDRPNRAPHQLAKVLYISNCAKYSFITETLLRKLLLINWSQDFPVIDIDNETTVCIQWHFPDVANDEVTTHLVVKDDRFEIILRKEDWERPIKDMIRKKSPQYKCHRRIMQQPLSAQRGEGPKVDAPETEAIKAERTKQATDIDSGSDTEAESEQGSLVFSRTSTTSTATSRSDDVDIEANANSYEDAQKCNGDSENEDEARRDSAPEMGNSQRSVEAEDEESDENEEGGYDSETSSCDESDLGEVEIFEDPQTDSPGGMQENDAYWTWDSDQERWFHKDPDGSPIRWFPERL